MKKIFSLLLLTFSTFVLSQTANDATFIVAEGATYTGTLTGESAQSFTVSATPKNGTVTIQSNGSFTYVHNGAESTSDSFTFTVTGSDNSASPAATVSVIVTPVNDKPSVTATATKTINEGETVTLVVSGTDTEGATLVYEVTTAPAQGTFLINKSTGYGTYVHGGGEADSDRIIVKVKEYDDANSFSSQTITITVTDVNDMPIAPDSTIAVLEGGTSQSASFGATDAEIDYAAITNNNNNTDVLTFNISSQGSYGTATAAKDGTFTYQHGGTEILMILLHTAFLMEL
jgi:VCBS repeat-containing protein